MDKNGYLQVCSASVCSLCCEFLGFCKDSGMECLGFGEKLTKALRVVGGSEVAGLRLKG